MYLWKIKLYEFLSGNTFLWCSQASSVKAIWNLLKWSDFFLHSFTCFLDNLLAVLLMHIWNSAYSCHSLICHHCNVSAMQNIFLVLLFHCAKYPPPHPLYGPACMYSLPLLPSTYHNHGCVNHFAKTWVSFQKTTYKSKNTKYFCINLLLTWEQLLHAPTIQIWAKKIPPS